MRNLHRPLGLASGLWPLCWPPQASHWRTMARPNWFGRCSNRGSRLRGKAQLPRRSSRAEQRGKSPGTPALRPKGKSSIWEKAPKVSRAPSFEAPGSAALSAFPLFVLKHLPPRWNAELRCQSSQTHLMTCKAVCLQTPGKWRGCSDHHASSLPDSEAYHQISSFSVDTRLFDRLRNSPQWLLSNHWTALEAPVSDPRSAPQAPPLASPVPPDLHLPIDQEPLHDCAGPTVMLSFDSHLKNYLVWGFTWHS